MDLSGNHLSGISSLMNKQNINQYVDVDQIERQVLNISSKNQPKKEDYTMEVDKLVKELGIDIGSGVGLKPIILDDDDSVAPPPSNRSRGTHQTICSNCSRRSVRPIQPQHNTNVYEHRIDITDEHQHKAKVMEVFTDMRKENTTGFSMNIERTRDAKANKIEQISNICSSLDEEGIDIKGFQIPTIDSSMEEIDSILNLVNMKMNRTRYSSLFEEIVMGGAEFMESKLDGTRSIPPFGWKPDYSGYSNTVSVKLHRMRYETSRLVGTGMEKMNIGSTTRILMELLPSLLLYPKTNALGKKKKSGDIAGSFGNIRSRVENDWDAWNNV
jgi:hypothetical protein